MTDAVTQAEARPQSDLPPVHTRAVVIGTGFSGLGMAIALQQQGVDFVILEKAADVGGTWRDNSYPAARVTSRRTCTPSPSNPSRTGRTRFRISPRSGTTSRG
jgi:cation diffusion facilitator CzcD-associated flavoprotein CzcO